MREPTLTIMPPSSAGSTRISTATRRADGAAQLLGQRRAPRFVERLRDSDLCGDLAAALGELPQIRLDHLRHREQPAVARDHAEEIARQSASARPLRSARRSPGPAPRATAPGCATGASGRRSAAASRATRANRRPPRQARAARRRDRTAPPRSAQPARIRPSLRKPMETEPQSARRRRRVASCCVGRSRRRRAPGAAAPRRTRRVPNIDGSAAQPPLSTVELRQHRHAPARRASAKPRKRLCKRLLGRFTPCVRSATALGSSTFRPNCGRTNRGEKRANGCRGRYQPELSAGHYALSMAGVLCRLGRLDARRGRFRPLFAGPAAGAQGADGEPDPGRYRAGRRA